MSDHRWPELPYDAWKDTYATLHLWTQVVGKIRLACMPWLNHTWQVTLYPSARGLSTGRLPYAERGFELELDFVAHRLHVRVSDGADRSIALTPMSVAQFYESVTSTLTALGMPVSVYTKPSEVDDPIAFHDDDEHRSYDARWANRCWRIMCSTADVLGEFRSTFYGKASPVHFFWGAFDLAVTRFSGRVAPLHPGGVPNLPDRVVRDAYSHEVSSAGFWPGGVATPYALFYSYAYPEPNGFTDMQVTPSAARYDTTLKEFVLSYDDMRKANDPEAALMAFLHSTYEAAADLGQWDRAALEVPAERLATLQYRGPVSR